jgi:hypothetical protein
MDRAALGIHEPQAKIAGGVWLSANPARLDLFQIFLLSDVTRRSRRLRLRASMTTGHALMELAVSRCGATGALSASRVPPDGAYARCAPLVLHFVHWRIELDAPQRRGRD